MKETLTGFGTNLKVTKKTVSLKHSCVFMLVLFFVKSALKKQAFVQSFVENALKSAKIHHYWEMQHWSGQAQGEQYLKQASVRYTGILSICGTL